MSGEDNYKLREAYEDLDRYLADQVAPLLVSDSIELLLDYPPALTGESLRVWAVGQFRMRGGSESLSVLLFHAIKKIQLFEEFNLMPKERFAAFLAEVAEHLMAAAPEDEREALAGMLAYLRQGRGASVSQIGQLHRAGSGAVPIAQQAPNVAPLSAEEKKSLRRFTMLADRLTQRAAGEEGQTTDDAARQLLILAAAGSTSAEELEARLARLQQIGIGPAFARDLVRTLSTSIPDWVVRRPDGVDVVAGESVEAVRRVVKLAGDGARSAERWKDLLRTAAESFNQGAYARSVTLLDLADRMVADREVDHHVAAIARGAGHEAFDPMRVLEVAADPENRPILRRLVEFFPEWSVRELLDALTWQPDSKRRRLVLVLLEVWGQEAYVPVLERLATAIAEGLRDPAWWYLRNLVYLLHRLPRPAEVDPKQVLELAGRFSSMEEHPSFQRETFTLLGQLPSGAGAPLLIQRLAEAERALAVSSSPPHEPGEMAKILNALAAALVRSGSPAARKALVDHGLGNRPNTGDASSRLRELAVVDLSHDRDALARLIEAARALVPRKVLGFVVARNEETLADIARALASTSDPSARRLLAELSARFPDRDFGRIAAAGPPAATTAVDEVASPEDDAESFVPAPTRAAPARTRASLSGDLEVFGLPGLLQNLQQSEASGKLVLRDANGAERAALDLVEGRLGKCRCGTLRGEEAFYQIFEVPSAGTFEFARETAAQTSTRPRGAELMALLMEAMRRFDEFQRLRALVPDDARLVPGGSRPTAPPGEQDGELVRRLWTKLRAGASVSELEAAAEVDAFRARALLAHWLEEGAAEIATSSSAAAG